ncbi:CBS domain-containing protein [Streptomyces sp. ISL-1]|uniref:CBS domain-containing protein n=1 Tax=Streptomyces sp. ISL-1 TaxID=2817657 RepID=UPI001BE616BB|nr:CBS domain-containing protein [Streptomyces sp. ISL-1]MBT2391826.1 CBS domain-containing protein [Streptomyces sp. ISL-1]
MARQVREIMTGTPAAVGPQTSVAEVARRMREEDIGAVLVVEGDRLRGLVTDRDLVVRALADGRNVDETTVSAACSDDLVAVSPDDDAERAVQLMRERAVRRLPVIENGHPVGIVSPGDLAIERDPGSALGDISSAEPNQ